jgi:hypothetical protein
MEATIRLYEWQFGGVEWLSSDTNTPTESLSWIKRYDKLDAGPVAIIYNRSYLPGFDVRVYMVIGGDAVLQAEGVVTFHEAARMADAAYQRRIEQDRELEEGTALVPDFLTFEKAELLEVA